MTEIRAPAADDLVALDAFLKLHSSSSMFLRSNLHRAGLRYEGAPFQARYVAAFGPDGDVIGVAAHASNGNILLQCPEETIRSRVLERLQDVMELPIRGVTGEPEQVQSVVDFFDLAQAGLVLDEEDHLFTLDIDEMSVPPGHGELAPAIELDRHMLFGWLKSYNMEALGAQDEEALDLRLNSELDSGVALENRWALAVDGKFVSLCGLNARLPDVVQIGPVWTPAQDRKQGYARLAVAKVLQLVHGEGVLKAVLFARNEFAVRAYQSIGFHRVGSYRLAMLGKPLDHRVLTSTDSAPHQIGRQH